MKRPWILLSGAVALFVAIAGACATSATNPPAEDDDDDSGGAGGVGGDTVGGMGGMGGAGGGGMGGMAGASSSSSSASTGGAGGGGPNLCGNGMIDPPEQCDGADYGGKTCESLGLGSGTLQCNQFCGIVASSCKPKETCQDFTDNNQNGLIDCDDPECAAEPTCTDSCTPPKIINVPYFGFGSTQGRPSTHAPSCTATSGKEIIFEVVAPVDGDLTATLDSFNGANFSLSVTTACGDVATELACKNDVMGGFGTETLSMPVTAGNKFYVMIDGVTAQDAGDFNVQINVAGPEIDCNNFNDDDFDILMDCEDPGQCQSLPVCAPGPGAAGSPCTVNSDCAANANDPVCFDQNFWGVPNGYCSEFCNFAANDCPAGSVCGNSFFWQSGNGNCFKSCTQQSDCPLNTFCSFVGNGQGCTIF